MPRETLAIGILDRVEFGSLCRSSYLEIFAKKKPMPQGDTFHRTERPSHRDCIGISMSVFRLRNRHEEPSITAASAASAASAFLCRSSDLEIDTKSPSFTAASDFYVGLLT